MKRKKHARQNDERARRDRASAADDDEDSRDDSRRERGSRRAGGRGAAGPLVRLSWRKKLAFAAATTLVVLLLAEGGLWLFGIRPVIATEDPYVGFSSLSPLFEETKDADGNVWMQTAENKRKWFNVQRFLRDKPAGEYRIFCLGGSTTFGRPYDDTTSFCGFLEAYLPAADSSRKWEVINCGGISYASYREALIVEEACRYKPDLFIIYGGQNEFLEARTYHKVIETPPVVRGLGSLAARTRLYAVAHQAVQAARGTPDDDDRDVLDENVKARLDRSVGPAEYHRDDEERRQIVEHYRYSLSRMIDTARASGAGVLLVRPASNLRHMSPFKSEHSAEVAADDEKVAAYKKAYDEAAERLRAAVQLAEAVAKADADEKTGTKKSGEDSAKDSAAVAGDATEKTPPKKTPPSDPEQWSDAEKGRWAVYSELRRALMAADRAVGIDPQYADGHYLRGQILDQLREYVEAKQAYQRALEEDVCPLRAPQEICDVVTAVGRERDVPVIDFEKIIADVSPQGIADREWLLDHVHPSPGGHKLLADAIVERMIEDGTVADNGAWTEGVRERIAQSVIARIDKRKHGEAMRNLSKVLEWAGKKEEAAEWAAAAITQVPEDAESMFRAAQGAEKRGDVRRAMALYRQCLVLDPTAALAHANIARLYEEAGEFDEALKHYRSGAEFAAQRGEKDMQVMARAHAGGVLAKLGRLDEAEKELRAAIAFDPNYAEAHNKLSRVLALQQRWSDAQEEIAAAQRLDPRNATFVRNEASLLVEMRRYDEAKRVLDRALAIDAEAPQTHAALADVHLQLGELDEAAEAYRKALRIAPEFDAARGNLAKILIEQQRFDEAERVLHGASGPQVAVAAGALAWRLATAGEDRLRNGERAVEIAERVRKVVGERWPRGLDILAAAYAEAGRFDDAVTTANLAVAAATEAKDDKLAAEIKQRLEGYRQGKPHRER